MRTNHLGNLLFCLAVPGAIGTVQASHIVGAEIDVHFMSNDQYEVRLLLWRDCSGPTLPASQQVAFTSPCGSGNLVLSMTGTFDATALCAADMPNSNCNGGNLPGIERYEYATIATFAPCDAWALQWEECCTSASNTLGSIALVTHTTLNNVDLVCRDAPRFAHPGTGYMPSDAPFSVDLLGMIDGPGVADYALVPLLEPGGAPVPYAAPYSGAYPYEGMSMSSTTGIVTTDSTASTGNWMIVARLEHWDGGGGTLATVERAFSLPTATLVNSPPLQDGMLQYVSGTGNVTGARTMDLQAGGNICVQASYFDANLNDSVFLTSDITTALPGASINSVDGNPAGAIYCWTAPMGASGTYHFITMASDEHCPVDGRQYYLYAVRIVPDTVNPCLNVGIAGTGLGNAGMVVVVDPAQTSLVWILPGTATAAQVSLYDLRGSVLLDRRVAPSRTGTLPLPSTLANGVYVVACGAYRAQVTIAR